MARTAITPVSPARNGSVAVTFANVDSANGMVVSVGDPDKLILLLRGSEGTGAAQITATLKAGVGGDQGDAWMAGKGNLAITVAIGPSEYVLGPFDSAQFEQTDGNVYLDFSATGGGATALARVAAIRMP